MSINALGSVSLYEYYYKLNNDKKETDTETTEKITKEPEKESSPAEIPYEDRPWADMMYQLDIPFSNNPKDDVRNISNALDKLLKGIEDNVLTSEIKDLKDYIQRLYDEFETRPNTTGGFEANFLNELDNISRINRAGIY